MLHFSSCSANVRCSASVRVPALLPALPCAGPNLRRGLTRRRALHFFNFLVSPHSGLAQRVLDHDPSAGSQSQPGTSAAAGRRGKPQGGKQPAAMPAPPSTPASAANLRLRQSLLELLKAVFAAPGSPFVADKFVSGGQLVVRRKARRWGARPRPRLDGGRPA